MEINGYKIGPLADLQKADLQGANLRETFLQGANLQEANLPEANLQGTNLQRANLRRANLQGVNLQGANLRGADLWRANLWRANLRGADLQRVFLRGAILQGAILQGANLQGADLQGANIDTRLTHIKRDEGELNALKRLKEITTKEQYDSYYRYGYINEGNTTFKINELTYTPQGIYCLEIRSNKYLPRADRIIHRLLLYKHNKDKFFELAQKRI